MAKTLIRERIAPSVPFMFSFEEPNGDVRTMAFKLAFDLNAFTLFEATTGINLLAEPGKVFDQPSVTTLTALFWVAIQLNHSEYEGPEGLHLVRSLLSLPELGQAREAMLNAFIAQLPKAQRETLNKLKQKGEGIGDETTVPLAPETVAAQ